MTARALALSALLAVATGCTTGEGKGWVNSERLFIEQCWNGPFDLGPDFFAALPFEEKAVIIRVQRGDNNQEVSDGLHVLVNNLQEVRRQTGPVPVGLPRGVSPPGVPIVANPNPPDVSLTLYLHDTCHGQNGNVYAVRGNITFRSLFSGDLNESDADDRLTEAEFEADFVDPRKAEFDGSYAPELVSRVRGYFRFYFQRGQPAQPFL